MHPFQGGPRLLSLGLIFLLYTMLVWCRDVLRESMLEGHHTKVIQLGLRYGSILFIVLEIISRRHVPRRDVLVCEAPTYFHVLGCLWIYRLKFFHSSFLQALACVFGVFFTDVEVVTISGASSCVLYQMLDFL